MQVDLRILVGPNLANSNMVNEFPVTFVFPRPVRSFMKINCPEMFYKTHWLINLSTTLKLKRNNAVDTQPKLGVLKTLSSWTCRPGNHMNVLYRFNLGWLFTKKSDALLSNKAKMPCSWKRYHHLSESCESQDTFFKNFDNPALFLKFYQPCTYFFTTSFHYT